MGGFHGTESDTHQHGHSDENTITRECVPHKNRHEIRLHHVISYTYGIDTAVITTRWGPTSQKDEKNDVIGARKAEASTLTLKVHRP